MIIGSKSIENETISNDFKQFQKSPKNRSIISQNVIKNHLKISWQTQRKLTRNWMLIAKFGFTSNQRQLITRKSVQIDRKLCQNSTEIGWWSPNLVSPAINDNCPPESPFKLTESYAKNWPKLVVALLKQIPIDS